PRDALWGRPAFCPGRPPHAARRGHELAPVPERAGGGRPRLLGVYGGRLPPRLGNVLDPSRGVTGARSRGAGARTGGSAGDLRGGTVGGRARSNARPDPRRPAHEPGERVEPHVPTGPRRALPPAIRPTRRAGRAHP